MAYKEQSEEQIKACLGQRAAADDIEILLEAADSFFMSPSFTGVSRPPTTNPPSSDARTSQTLSHLLLESINVKNSHWDYHSDTFRPDVSQIVSHDLPKQVHIGLCFPWQCMAGRDRDNVEGVEDSVQRQTWCFLKRASGDKIFEKGIKNFEKGTRRQNF